MYTQRSEQELELRMDLWNSLLNAGGTKGVAPSLLRNLKIYGGAQGIWVDKARTSELTEDGEGVTVSLLHTGTSYADDLMEDGVLYHYQNTNRPKTRDLSEIAATKSAARLALPVFVIAYPTPGSSMRDVYLGWIEDWDDNSGMFLVTFRDEQRLLSREANGAESPFRLVEKVRTAKSQVNIRQGQQRFKFRVFRRYGAHCAVCGISVLEVLDAAHIRPKRENGSDDPRNGLVLCALHHRAMDSNIFAVEPANLRIHYKERGPDASDLHIRHSSLEHLSRKPHKEALEWLWKRWKARN